MCRSVATQASAESQVGARMMSIAVLVERRAHQGHQVLPADERADPARRRCRRRATTIRRLGPTPGARRRSGPACGGDAGARRPGPNSSCVLYSVDPCASRSVTPIDTWRARPSCRRGQSLGVVAPDDDRLVVEDAGELRDRGVPGRSAPGPLRERRHEALREHHELGSVAAGLVDEAAGLVDRGAAVEDDGGRLHGRDADDGHARRRGGRARPRPACTSVSSGLSGWKRAPCTSRKHCSIGWVR